MRTAIAAFLRAFFATEIRAWNGGEPLAKVFWGYGVLASAVLAAVTVVTMSQGQAAAEQMLHLMLAGYTGWLLVSIWRCAANADPFWRTLARHLAVGWGINTALVLLFRELDMLTRWTGH